MIDRMIESEHKSLLIQQYRSFNQSNLFNFKIEYLDQLVESVHGENFFPLSCKQPYFWGKNSLAQKEKVNFRKNTVHNFSIKQDKFFAEDADREQQEFLQQPSTFSVQNQLQLQDLNIDQCEKCNPSHNLVESIAQTWRSQLETDAPQQSDVTRESIIHWLLGQDQDRLATLEPAQLKITQQAMAYRYRILKQRYLGVTSEKAYRNLTTRLSNLVMLWNKIRTSVALSRDRQRAVVDVLQEVLQELLQRDRYMQQQITWISECTSDLKLRNALLFTSIEEYCLRPIRNQPLLVYRFVNYLQRGQRGGLTQVPSDSTVRLISEEILQDDSDNPLNLLDTQAIAAYQDQQAMEEQQSLRQEVKQEFCNYLDAQLGATAVQWFQLYLQGKSQKAIAQQLNLSVKEAYRLREKVNYYAVRVFAVKAQPELVSKWLETSLQEHNFGLKPQQWQQFWQQLPPIQQQIIELLQTGKNFEQIAQILNRKPNHIVKQWTDLYLTAQTIRTES